MNSMISLTAVAIAGFLNSFCMRLGEMKTGIMVQDENGEDIGISKICAKKAVMNTAFSRILLSCPIFLIPAISMLFLGKFGLIPRSKGPKAALELCVVAFSLTVALPLSVAIFP